MGVTREDGETHRVDGTDERRVDSGIADDLTYRPFLALLGCGVAVRVIVMALYWPAIMLSFDSPRFARIDGKPLFSDYWMPAAYPAFLRVLRAISDQLWFTIAVQHLIGIGIGVLVYLALRRLGIARWVACVPAAVAFLSGDHVYLEHMIMADFLLGFLAVAGLTAALFGLTPRVRLPYLALASPLLGTALLVRSVGVLLLPVLALCVFVFTAGALRESLRPLAAAILPGAAVVGIYIAACAIVDGKFWGITDMSGWNLYSRVAPFADCTQFTPPAGTEVLCEDTVPAARPGPFGYVWDKQSISRRHFKLGPNTSHHLGAFARQVILHQPLDYMRAVVIDLSRYIEPATGRQWPYAGQTDATWAFGWRDPGVEERVSAALSRGYRGTRLNVRAESVLNYYQHLFRVTGLMLAALVALTLIGIARSRGILRVAILLFGLSAFGLYVLPVLTVSYDFRYGLPPIPLIAVSGVLGAVSLWRRDLATHSPSTPDRAVSG
jgi:hypothetical protein